MRAFQSDQSSFVDYVEKTSQSYWNQSKNKILRNHVVDSSNLEPDPYYYTFPDSKLTTMIRFCILHWYAPEEIQFTLRMDLEERIKYFSPEDQYLLSLLLNSRAEMLLFLIDTHLWHERDFRGNVLVKNIKSLPLLKLRKRIKYKIKYPVRKRGYHDHGSRVLSHEWLPKHDYSLTELQNKIELERKTQIETLHLTQGILE